MPIKEWEAAGVDEPESKVSFISHKAQGTSTFASARMSSPLQLGQPTGSDRMVTLPLVLILVSFIICYKSERLSRTIFQYTPTVTQRTLCARQCAASLTRTGVRRQTTARFYQRPLLSSNKANGLISL